MKTAALDLGSNSFLCLISEKTLSGDLKVLEDVSIITRLAQSVQKEGVLSKEALVRAAQAFSQFKDLIEKHSVEKVQAVTTAAARDAENFQDLIDVGAKYGVPISVIPGKEEAFLSFSGAVKQEDQATSLLLDIGGGSTEMAYLKPDGSLFLKSLPLGSVRLGEMFVSSWESLSQSDLNKVEEQILKTLDLSWEEERPPKLNWVAVAGTPTTLKAVELGVYEDSKINNSTLTLSQVKALNEKFMSLTLSERRKVPGLSPKRADVIPVGTKILETLMSWAGVEEVGVSTRGLRYGLAARISN